MKYLYLIFSFGFLSCGNDGSDGKDGATGSPGKNGTAQGIDMTRFTSDTAVCLSGSGVIIQIYHYSFMGVSKTIDATAVVCDGLSGKDGEIPSPSPYDVVQIIDPCGDTPAVYDEVILKMADGSLIASFSDNSSGKNTRLSILVDGNYSTTDGSGCSFSVNGGSINW